MSIRETPEDRDEEGRVSLKVARMFKCETVPTETLCPYDFSCIRENKRVALLEVRKRSCMHDEYYGLWMSKKKYCQLTLLALAYGDIPVIFVIAFDDGDFWIDISKLTNIEIEEGSRGENPKGGARSTDNELVVVLPNKFFKPF